MGVLFGGQSGQEKQLQGQFQSIFPQLTDNASKQFTLGSNTLSKGTGDLNSVSKFFKTLLTGNRAAVTSALSPEIQAVKDQYDATKKTIANTQARSGSTAASENELSNKKAGDIGQLFTTARTRGAQGLTGVGEALSSIGLSSSSLGASEIGAVLQSLLGQEGVAGQQAQRQQDALAGIGQLVGTIATVGLA